MREPLDRVPDGVHDPYGSASRQAAAARLLLCVSVPLWFPF